MIQFNKEYVYSRGKGKIVFSNGKNDTITATYKVYNDEGTITGKFNGDVLEATFHSTSLNRVGLIHFTFTDDGFDAKWKNGLEPGTMRGRWFTADDKDEANFVFDIHKSNTWGFEDSIENEIERIFQLQDEKLRNAFVENATQFINKNQNYFWLTLLIYYKAQECYYDSGNDDLEDFFVGFEIKSSKLNFDAKEKFKLYYYPDRDSEDYWMKPSDFKWSADDEIKTSFLEALLQALEINLDTYEDNAFNYAQLRNAAISYLWVSLQEYCSDFPENEELANCLWSVFSDSAHDIEIFKADGNFCQEALDNVLKYILRIDKEQFNADENPAERDDLNSFNDYVHDYIAISQEILDKDIFDM